MFGGDERDGHTKFGDNNTDNIIYKAILVFCVAEPYIPSSQTRAFKDAPRDRKRRKV
jgi:hypothetical protein